MKRKTALITGSSRGIGRSIALKLAKEGYSVIINGAHNKNDLDQLEEELRQIDADCFSFFGDISSYDVAASLFDIIQNKYGSIEILINNAGISHVGLFTDMSRNEWDMLMSTNVGSIFNCCQLAVPSMVSKKYGKIINISSVWGIVGASCEVAYSASKGAINAFTLALAKELAPSNIQVNAVACGAIDTDMNHCFSEEELTALQEEIPYGRMAKPDEVADFILLLCKSSNYLTGQVIKFDGGWI